MSDLHILSTELAQELHLVVARHAERRSCLDHVHHQSKHTRYIRSAIDEISEEHDLPALRVPAVRLLVAELVEQCFELRPAAMDLTDHVERAVLILAVVPEPLPFEDCCLDNLR